MQLFLLNDVNRKHLFSFLFLFHSIVFFVSDLTTQKLVWPRTDDKQKFPLRQTKEFSLTFNFPAQQQQQQQQLHQQQEQDMDEEDLEKLLNHRASIELHLEVAKSGSNSTRDLDPLVAIAFKNVDRILSIESNSLKEVGSIILSLVPPKTKSNKNRNFILRKVTFDIPLVTQSGVRHNCVAWSNHIWSSDHCRVIKTNSSHTTCSCEAADDVTNLWTRFGLAEVRGQALIDGDNFSTGGIFRSAAFDDLSTATIVIVAVSAALLVGSLLAVALLIVYCRRVKVRFILFWHKFHCRTFYLTLLNLCSSCFNSL
jgi:hypothetical protein